MNDQPKQLQKREPKRFSTPFEIKVEIFRLQRMANEKEKSAYLLEKAVKEYLLKANDESDTAASRRYWADQAKHERDKMERLRSSANSIRTTRVRALGDALAELQTTPMAFLNDTSVTTRKAK